LGKATNSAVRPPTNSAVRAPIPVFNQLFDAVVFWMKQILLSTISDLGCRLLLFEIAGKKVESTNLQV